MKKFIRILDLLLFIGVPCMVASLLIVSCQDEVKNTVTYTVNEPVYMPFAQFRAQRVAQPTQAMVNPGKICLYSSHLFINEVGKGIHIIDNSNPAAPRPIAFIELEGNIDITVRNNMLYADSYIDLVWFDISNPSAPVEVGRLPDAFRNIYPTIDNSYPIAEIDNTKGVVVGWKVKDITVDVETRHYFYEYYMDFASSADGGNAPTSGGGSSTALTGSMARFAACGNYLYVVNEGMLKVFDLSGQDISKIYDQYLAWNVETIFAYNSKLFFGTTTGMLIYDITDPITPKYLSSVTHILGCDPVVVQDNYAYVTVRGGNTCGQIQSQLNVVDISNPSAPFTRASFIMQSPYGLGIDGNSLFVCDKGLKVFDASTPAMVGDRLVKHFDDIAGFDVIPYNNVLILIGSDGLRQYDYSDQQNISLLSTLNVQAK